MGVFGNRGGSALGVGKTKMDISICSAVDNIVFSKKEMFAFYRVTSSVYDFLSDQAKLNLGHRLVTAYSQLMQDRAKELDCYLVVTSFPVNVDKWAEQIHETTSAWGGDNSNLEMFLAKEIVHLKMEEFTTKVTYLGVSLGRVGEFDLGDLNVLEAGLHESYEAVKDGLNKALRFGVAEVSRKQEDAARKREADIFNRLKNSELKCTRATSEEILLLLKKQFYPQMPAPALDVDYGNRFGAGDLVLELGSHIKNRARWLEITQIINGYELTGFRATLSISKLPNYIEYPRPDPFLYLPAYIGMPFTLYSRFTLIPNEEMKKSVQKIKLEQEDEAKNQAQAGVNPSIELLDAVSQAQQMDSTLAEDKNPWVSGSYRIVVEAQNLEQLKEFCQAVKTEYANSGITVSWTSGDQALLFLEQMPGDHLRINSFTHSTNLEMLATSGFNFSNHVGDEIKQ